MSQIGFRCTNCNLFHKEDIWTLECSECKSPLDIEYLSNLIGRNLPINNFTNGLSLSEGNTPIVQLHSLDSMLGLKFLYGKLEYLNPTGSFKDRGVAVMLAIAKENGVSELVEDSSGNAGASVAAYAARLGMTAHIFAPSSTPQAKLIQIKKYGPKLHLIDGTRVDTTKSAVSYVKNAGLMYASHALSPYFLDGMKSFAYEVVEQFGNDVPDHLVIPVGNGGLFLGAWKGFVELIDAERIKKMPRLHCIQSSVSMPIVADYNGIDWKPDTLRSTVAGGICVEYPARRRQILEVLRITEGTALAVDDIDILRWQNRMAQKEGIFAEPTSAVAFAGLEKLVDQKVISSSEIVLVPITGFGLKDIISD